MATPLRLCKHKQNQENDSQTGSPCLDKAMLVRGGGAMYTLAFKGSLVPSPPLCPVPPWRATVPPHPRGNGCQVTVPPRGGGGERHCQHTRALNSTKNDNTSTHLAVSVL